MPARQLDRTADQDDGARSEHDGLSLLGSDQVAVPGMATLGRGQPDADAIGDRARDPILQREHVPEIALEAVAP